MNGCNLISIFYALYWHLAMRLQSISLCNSQMCICNLTSCYFQLPSRHLHLNVIQAPQTQCIQTKLLIFPQNLVLLLYALAQFQASTLTQFSKLDVSGILNLSLWSCPHPINWMLFISPPNYFWNLSLPLHSHSH